MRHASKARMEMVPTVIGDGQQIAGDGPLPPRVAHRSRLEIRVLGIIRVLHRGAGLRRSNDEAGGTELRLCAPSVEGDEILHCADKTPLESKLRVNEIVDVEDRTIVKSESNVACFILRMQ